MSRHAARKDANHAAIEAVFRKMLADHVTDSSGWGEGAGDLYCSFGQYGCWIEIKADEKADFTAAQIAFRRVHPSVHFRCDSIDQAVTLCRYIRKQAAKLAE